MAEPSSSTQNPTMQEASSSTLNLENSPGNNPTPEISPQDKGKNILQENYFSFTLTPAYKLKRAIAVLAEPDLNPDELARIDVSKAGFEMTVYDKLDYGERGLADEVIGYLGLKADALSNFECNTPMTGMIGKLDGIDKFLATVGDQDSVKVFSVDSLKLCFEFVKLNDSGVPHCHRITASLINARTPNKFPTVSCAFEILLPSDKTRPLLNAIMTDISNGVPPIFAQAKVDKTGTIRAGNSAVRVEEANKDQMWFLMSCWKAVEKASLLTETCRFYLVKRPGEHIMLRYSLKELGDLVILKSTQKCSSDGMLPILFAFAPLA